MSIGTSLMRHAVGAFVSLAALGGDAFAEPLDFQKLHLINHWERYSTATRTPSVAIDADNIVYLRGAVRQPTTFNDDLMFVLPEAYRPSRLVIVRTNLVVARKGRLTILPNGKVSVQADDAFTSAQAFTSLEGVSFSRK
jgi:hypothetical protein